MVYQSNSYFNNDELTFKQIQEADHKGGAQSTLFELVIELQYSRSRNLAAIRKAVAPYGDAYFYFNSSGDLCLVTDFIKIAK